jgi:hypothetical protein
MTALLCTAMSLKFIVLKKKEKKKESGKALNQRPASEQIST